MEVFIEGICGTTTAAVCYTELPAGYTIDPSKFNNSTTTYHPVGEFGIPTNNTDDTLYMSVRVDDASLLNAVYPTVSSAAGYNYNSSRNWSWLFSSSNKFFMRYKVPIQGWNTNFNPLLSMPLVEIGGNSGQYLQNGWGGTRNYRLYGGTAVVDDLQGMATVTQGSSTISWQYNALVRHKVTMSVTAGLNGTDSYLGILCGTSALVNDSSVSVTDASFNSGARKATAEIKNGDIDEISASWIMEAGEMVTLGLSSTTAPHTGTTNASISILAERDFSNTNMAHIIKPAVANVSGVFAYNVPEGSGTTGSWATRVLNTVSGESWFVTLSGTGSTGVGGTNTDFTLEPGTYELDVRSPFMRTGYSYLRLYDVTNSAAVSGSTAQAQRYIKEDAGVENDGDMVFRHTMNLTSSTEFRLQYHIANSASTWALGSDSNTQSTQLTNASSIVIRKLK